MNHLQAFFAQNAEVETTEEIVISERFKDNEGKPIPFKIRSITEEENAAIRKASTRRVKGKHGSYTTEFNHEDYLAKMTAAGVMYPPIKDVELQNSYGVVGEEALLRKMLRPGEYAELIQRVQVLNGYDKDTSELVDEVKN